MNIHDFFSSNYLKASDLGGQTHAVIIENVTAATFDDGSQKPVIKFVTVDKMLVLNRTNSMALAGVFSPDTATWTGKTIEIFSMQVPFQGRMVDAIRVRIPAAPAQNGLGAAPAAAPIAAVPAPAAQPATSLSAQAPAAAQPSAAGAQQPLASADTSTATGADDVDW